MYTRQSSIVKNIRPPLRFQKSQPKKHRNVGANLDRVPNELGRELIWRICDYSLAPLGQFLGEKITPVEVRRISVVQGITADNDITMGA